MVSEVSVPRSEFRVLCFGWFVFRVSCFGFRVSPFRVSASGFQVSGSGFWGLVFVFRVPGFVVGLRVRVPGSAFRVSDFGFRVSAVGFRVLVPGFWLQVDLGCWLGREPRLQGEARNLRQTYGRRARQPDAISSFYHLQEKFLTVRTTVALNVAMVAWPQFGRVKCDGRVTTIRPRQMLMTRARLQGTPRGSQPHLRA